MTSHPVITLAARLAAHDLLKMWIDDGYPCCERYSVGAWSGKVYAHDEDEDQCNLYPSVCLSSPNVSNGETYIINFKPIRYEVWWVGLLKPEGELQHYTEVKQ